ncbi:50S ribosomal protein L6 [Candidatus Woesearchaeota archaeon]|nr:50S ribosomal protein L6 [Candidatus Woesearchaeota archaeon]
MKKKEKGLQGFKTEIGIPEKVGARLDNNNIIFKGGKGENSLDLSNPGFNVVIRDKKIMLHSLKNSKREKKIINTYVAHIKNCIKGVREGHRYELKICSSHFPMNVSVNNGQLIIKNFIGEKFPRTLSIKEGVSIKVDGDKITLESVDKSLAGTAASDIEKLTKRPNFDTRIFQDGIYITNKDGKKIK